MYILKLKKYKPKKISKNQRIIFKFVNKTNPEILILFSFL